MRPTAIKLSLPTARLAHPSLVRASKMSLYACVTAHETQHGILLYASQSSAAAKNSFAIRS